jgi:hypothetical protein
MHDCFLLIYFCIHSIPHEHLYLLITFTRNLVKCFFVFISITSVGGQLLIERIIRPEVSVSALALIITGH